MSSSRHILVLVHLYCRKVATVKKKGMQCQKCHVSLCHLDTKQRGEVSWTAQCPSTDRCYSKSLTRMILYGKCTVKVHFDLFEKLKFRLKVLVRKILDTTLRFTENNLFLSICTRRGLYSWYIWGKLQVYTSLDKFILT